jgi:hypothetical protein
MPANAYWRHFRGLCQFYIELAVPDLWPSGCMNICRKKRWSVFADSYNHSITGKSVNFGYLRSTGKHRNYASVRARGPNPPRTKCYPSSSFVPAVAHARSRSDLPRWIDTFPPVEVRAKHCFLNTTTFLKILMRTLEHHPKRYTPAAFQPDNGKNFEP